MQSTAARIPAYQSPSAAANYTRGLLVTGDPNVARSFQSELGRCSKNAVVETCASLDDAAGLAGARYDWVTIDLDVGIAPSEAVRLARRSWPNAQIAALTCWWSERGQMARELADHIIHKPVRASELSALLAGSNGRSNGNGKRTPASPDAPLQERLHPVI